MLQTFNHQGKSIEILRGGREWYLEMQSGVGVDRERRYLKGGGEGSGVFRNEEEVLSGVYGLRFLFLSDLVSFWEFYLISTSRRTLQSQHERSWFSIGVSAVQCYSFTELGSHTCVNQ